MNETVVLIVSAVLVGANAAWQWIKQNSLAKIQLTQQTEAKAENDKLFMEFVKRETLERSTLEARLAKLDEALNAARETIKELKTRNQADIEALKRDFDTAKNLMQSQIHTLQNERDAGREALNKQQADLIQAYRKIEELSNVVYDLKAGLESAQELNSQLQVELKLAAAEKNGILAALGRFRLIVEPVDQKEDTPAPPAAPIGQ